jgi:hypothetical protein
MMLLTIPISPDAEAKLRERAAASGRGVADYAAKLLEDAVSQPTMDDILEPVRADFAKSGMTEEQIMELGRRELETLRSERKAKSG